MMNKIKIGVLLVGLLMLIYLFLPQSEDKILKPKSTSQYQENIEASQVIASEEENEISVESNDDKLILDTQPTQNTIPKLNIQLYGLFPSKNEKPGYAFISYNQAPMKAYNVGDYLSEEVLLKSLSAKEMIIDNHGEFEKYLLLLKGKQDGDKLPLKLKPSKIDSNTPPIRSELPMNSDRPPEIIKPIEPRDDTPPPPDGGEMPGSYD